VELTYRDDLSCEVKVMSLEVLTFPELRPVRELYTSNKSQWHNKPAASITDSTTAEQTFGPRQRPDTQILWALQGTED